jgi:DNA polymerase elongation subunit (family B)
MSLYFDIETAPLPGAELAAIMPPFDPAEVKVGNIKDPALVAAKIAQSKAAYESDYIENAALDPLTGRVLCVGVMSEETPFILYDDNEAKLLTDFWSYVMPGRRLIGFNSQVFDLPFLIRRSWKHSIAIPAGVRNGRYWHDDMIDLRLIWKLGDWQAHGSLDSIAKHLGLGGKNGNGKDFAKLWETDRPKAVDYLKNDLALVAAIAQRMGVA